MISQDVLIEAIDMAYQIRKVLERDQVIFEEFRMSDDIRTTLEQQREALLFLIRHRGRR